MQKVKMVIARSGVVARTLIPPEVIIESAKQYNKEYLPLTIDHDIRRPPIGRIIAVEVVVLDDGTYVLQGEAEIFEESDKFDLIFQDYKSIKINVEEVNDFQVQGNQTFEEDKDIADLYKELQEFGGGDSYRKYREDSGDPISLLIIGFGLFSLSGIANGFFSKLGEDLYEKLKYYLKKIFEKKSLNEKENLLQFQLFVNSPTGRIIEVNIVITNPSQSDLDEFFTFVPTQLNTILSNLPVDELHVCPIVFSYKFPQLTLVYMLRLDGVPISMRTFQS